MSRPAPGPRKRGRPRVADETVGVGIKAPVESHRSWSEAADRAGVALAEWIRTTLDRAARRALR